MTLLSNRHLIRGLLLIGALLVQLTAQTQGLELFPLTRASQAKTDKKVPPPPLVSIFSNSSLPDRGLKLRLAEVAPKPKSSVLPLLAEKLRKLQVDINSIDTRLQLIKAGKSEEQLSKDPDYQRLNTEFKDLGTKRDILSAEQKQKEIEEENIRQTQGAVKDALQRQLNIINENYLNRVRLAITEENIEARRVLDSYQAEVEKIRKYQTTYWDSIPKPELASAEMRTADKAHLQFYRSLTKLEVQLADADKGYIAFKAAKDSLDKYVMNVADTSKASIRNFDRHIKYLQDTEPPLIAKLDTLHNSLTRYNQNVDKWKVDFKAAQDKKAGSANNLTALPAITGIKGTGLYIPAVSVIGSHRGGTDESPTITSIKLFTALGGPGDENDVPSKRGTERLFIPEASTFGFSANAAFAFSHASRKSPVMGIVVGAAYLDKRMTPDSMNTFTTGVASVRANLEWYLLPDVLMVYGGVNSLTFLTSRDQVTEHYTTNQPKDVYGFTTAGVRAILKPGGEASGVSFLFDLGFIFKGDNVRKFVPNDDFTITTIRATLAKNFALR